jgi:hypothetical protein
MTFPIHRIVTKWLIISYFGQNPTQIPPHFTYGDIFGLRTFWGMCCIKGRLFLGCANWGMGRIWRQKHLVLHEKVEWYTISRHLREEWKKCDTCERQNVSTEWIWRSKSRARCKIKHLWRILKCSGACRNEWDKERNIAQIACAGGRAFPRHC